MRMAILSLLFLMQAGCTGLVLYGDNATAWAMDEKAVKDGLHSQLKVGMPLEEAMNYLEKIGFKREPHSSMHAWSDGYYQGERDERVAFLYEKEIPGWSIVSGSAVVQVWLYYEAGKLIDFRVNHRSICL
jgi:hypothetical protein